MMLTSQLLKSHLLFISWIVIVLLLSNCNRKNEKSTSSEESQETNIKIIKLMDDPLSYQLPAPQIEGNISVEEALQRRRSHRNFTKSSISAKDLSQILWAAYGITKEDSSRPAFRGGLRSPPSAGATYPLELYVVVGNVDDIEPGVYRYISKGHKIVRTIDSDIRSDLAAAALNQEMIAIAPASLFYSAIFERTISRYGERGRLRYVPMDIGHSAQNVYLQAEALGLGTCAIGAFNDEKVSRAMQLPGEEEPLYIMPIGKYYGNE